MATRAPNEIGNRYGKLTVIARAPNDKRNKARWVCRCDCGKEVIVSASALRKGHTKSCGCLHKEKAGQNKIDLAGQKFNRLTVIKEHGRTSSGMVKWLCRCDCGNLTVVKSSDLRNGRIKSCGCYHIDRSTKHGDYKYPLYKVWLSMRERCYNPNNKAYPNYGGRGIKICDEWKDSYESFKRWALANGYKPGLYIDRIDNNKGYYPENCRWVTASESSRNQKKFITQYEAWDIFFAFTHRGYSIDKLAEIYNRHPATIRKVVHGRDKYEDILGNWVGV